MFSILSAPQIEEARPGRRQPARESTGELLFSAGDRHVPAYLVQSGSVEVMRNEACHEVLRIVVHRPRRLIGETSQLNGRQRPLLEGRAGPRAAALPFDAAHLRALIIGSAELGEIVMRAFILRRVGADRDGGAGSVLVGQPGCRTSCGCRGSSPATAIPNTVLDRRTTRKRRAPCVEQLRRAAGRAADHDLSERHGAEASHGRARPARCLGITPELDPEKDL